jgi:hypothetical protein
MLHLVHFYYKKSSPIQEFSRILWNSKVHNRLHRSLPLAPVLSQTNPVHALPCYFLRSTLILSSHIFVDLTCGSFIDFPTRTQYILLSHAWHVPCPSYSPPLHHFNDKRRGVYIIKFLVMQFSPATCYSIFGPTVSASWSWSPSAHVLPSMWMTKFQTLTNELKGVQSLF